MAGPVPEVVGYTDLVPLGGGGAGESFAARRVEDGRPVALRVYGVGDRHRGPEAPAVQAGVLRLVAGLVPAPEVVAWRAVGPSEPHGLLATTLLPGVPLAAVLPSAKPSLQQALGVQLGRILGRLAGIAMRGPGAFRDERLVLGGYPDHAESLVTWWDHYAAGSRLTDLSPARHATLRRLAARGDRLLAVSRRACLVHGDLRPHNVLVDPDTGCVTGLVDWEFVHAGHPVEDLGSLLREGRRTPFAAAVVEAMLPWLPDAEQAPPPDLVERARAADLYWIIEAASRRGQGPATDRAFEHLVAMADGDSLLAEPAEGPG
jgi:aminoglycoside phosphotransferase (APT) family kinase protein